MVTLAFVVQALHDPTGNQLLSPEIVENQFPVLPQGACPLAKKVYSA